MAVARAPPPLGTWMTPGRGSASLSGLVTDISVRLHSLNTHSQLAAADAGCPPGDPPGDIPSFSFRPSPGSSSDHGVGTGQGGSRESGGR